MNESCLIHRMSHVSHMIESAISHILLSSVSFMNAPILIYSNKLVDIWDMSHMYIHSRNCLIYIYVLCMYINSRSCLHICNIYINSRSWNPWYTRHISCMSNYRSLLQNTVSFIGLFCKSHTIRIRWLACRIHIWDMTHPHIRHDSFIYERWLCHIWDMIHSYMRYDSFICETWLSHTCNMTHHTKSAHSYKRRDSFTYETWLIRIW